MDDLATQIAAALIDIGAVGFTPQAPITFKSGLLSPIYVDNRQVPFYPQVWRLVIEGFQRLMQSLRFNPDLIAGIETAGIPHGAALAYRMGKPFVFVRKQAKDHGAKKLVEGGNVEGNRVLLIEDHVSTGGSSLAGVDALRKDGARVEHCFAISSYGFPEAAQQFGDAHVQLQMLVTLPTILDSARQKGRFGESELAVLRDWVRDPHGWAARQGFVK